MTQVGGNWIASKSRTILVANFTAVDNDRRSKGGGGGKDRRTEGAQACLLSSTISMWQSPTPSTVVHHCTGPQTTFQGL